MSGKVIAKKMGRPRKAAADKRSERVIVKMTKRERAAVEKVSGEKPLAAYMREKALASNG